MTGVRARKVALAGGVLHAHHRRPGVYTRGGVAECGANEVDGAEFTTWSEYVTCAGCLTVIYRRRIKAKLKLAELEAGS